MKVTIDYNKLKKEILEYYSKALEYHPMAAVKLVEIGNMNEEDLLEEAKKIGLKKEYTGK